MKKTPAKSNDSCFCRVCGKTQDKVKLKTQMDILNTYLCTECMNKTDKFKIKLYGLSKDMEDFMLEQADYYSEYPESNTKFWASFWKTCVDMWVEGIDLSHKQLEIIEREYKKVEKERRKT